MVTSASQSVLRCTVAKLFAAKWPPSLMHFWNQLKSKFFYSKILKHKTLVEKLVFLILNCCKNTCFILECCTYISFHLTSFHSTIDWLYNSYSPYRYPSIGLTNGWKVIKVILPGWVKVNACWRTACKLYKKWYKIYLPRAGARVRMK